MSEKLKPTPGPWMVAPLTPNRVDTRSGSISVSWSANHDGGQREREAEENASLIAEAGTVFHECGLSPRELLDKNQDYKAQNARLTAALRNLCKHFPTDADMAELGWEVEYVETACQAYDTARAVLATQKE